MDRQHAGWALEARVATELAPTAGRDSDQGCPRMPNGSHSRSPSLRLPANPYTLEGVDDPIVSLAAPIAMGRPLLSEDLRITAVLCPRTALQGRPSGTGPGPATFEAGPLEFSRNSVNELLA